VYDVKSMAVSGALVTASVVLSPVAHAWMLTGNYEVHTTRDPGHSWLWEVRPCPTGQPTDCVHVQGTPRPNGQAVPYNGNAPLVSGRYTMVIDQPDGVRCTIYFLPSHDVYTWDAATLTGTVDSTFDAGCGGAPGGTVSWPFSLTRY
jgi:hypothetical protein